jgi:hypothetical protein
MNRPWLSIVTITKDDPEGLSQTLASAGPLRTSGAEHIVVDGSAVGRETPIEPAVHPGVMLVRKAPEGVSDAFNAGLAGARGEWVWLLNGGDRVYPRLDPQFLLTLLRSSRSDLIIGGIVYEGEMEVHRHPPPHIRWPSLASWIPHPATLVRRRLFDRFGRFDPRYQVAMDYEWWLRVLGHDVAVDVLDVPFAVFAPGGMSQRPDSRARLNQERNDIIRRHQSVLWRNVIQTGLRLAKWWTRAIFSRRLPDRRAP